MGLWCPLLVMSVNGRPGPLAGVDRCLLPEAACTGGLPLPGPRTGSLRGRHRRLPSQLSGMQTLAGSRPGALSGSSAHWSLVSLPLLGQPPAGHQASKGGSGGRSNAPASLHLPPLPLRVCSGLENGEDGKYLLTGQGKYCPQGQEEGPVCRCQEQVQSGEPAWRRRRRERVLRVRAPEDTHPGSSLGLPTALVLVTVEHGTDRRASVWGGVGCSIPWVTPALR